MDPSDLGLPMSFGKQPSASSSSLPSKPPAQGQSSNRGNHAGRGSRGVVGANKRGRGRGGFNNGGGFGQDAGYGQRTSANQSSTAESSFTGGTKRPHPPSPNDSASSSNRNIPPNFRQNQHFSDRGNGRGRGGRGRGGGPRIQHGDGNGNGGGERGFWRDSFMEDPWRELEEQRARKASVV